jgi:hypothetical protein
MGIWFELGKGQPEKFMPLGNPNAVQTLVGLWIFNKRPVRNAAFLALGGQLVQKLRASFYGRTISSGVFTSLSGRLRLKCVND